MPDTAPDRPGEDDDQPCGKFGDEDTHPNFRMPELMFPEPRAALDQYLPAEQPEAGSPCTTPEEPPEEPSSTGL